MRSGLKVFLTKPGWMKVEVSKCKNPMTMSSLTLHQFDINPQQMPDLTMPSHVYCTVFQIFYPVELINNNSKDSFKNATKIFFTSATFFA